jgi:hypothetical protein
VRRATELRVLAGLDIVGQLVNGHENCAVRVGDLLVADLDRGRLLGVGVRDRVKHETVRALEKTSRVGHVTGQPHEHPDQPVGVVVGEDDLGHKVTLPRHPLGAVEAGEVELHEQEVVPGDPEVLPGLRVQSLVTGADLPAGAFRTLEFHDHPVEVVMGSNTYVDELGRLVVPGHIYAVPVVALRLVDELRRLVIDRLFGRGRRRGRLLDERVLRRVLGGTSGQDERCAEQHRRLTAGL